MNNKLFITDERMLAVMKWAIDRGLAAHETEFFEKIGFARTNMSNLRKGLQGFTKEHILKACELTGASADYVFGFSKIISRKPPADSLQLLKEAVLAVELDMKSGTKKGTSKVSKV